MESGARNAYAKSPRRRGDEIVPEKARPCDRNLEGGCTSCPSFLDSSCYLLGIDTWFSLFVIHLLTREEGASNKFYFVEDSKAISLKGE